MPALRDVVGLVVISCVAALAIAQGCSGSDQATATSDVSVGGSTGMAAGGNGGQACVPVDELCNGQDDDCDGELDEGCDCIDGDVRPCWTGPMGLEGIGTCAGGNETCDETGTWGSTCEGEVLPEAEICDGLDNDCNEQQDEGFTTITCGLGGCQVTVDECVMGVPQPCIPNMPSPTELCDGLDDDCDGMLDEGCLCINGQTGACYTGSPMTRNVGACMDGTYVCNNMGQWGMCMGDVTPQPETCNNIDDDCDSMTDENNPGGGAMCSTGQLGLCSVGTITCVNGQLPCVQNVQPSPEICNGLDDDCDGIADDGNPGGGAACNSGQLGVCAVGTVTCQMGMLVCVANTMGSPEICNGLDDDCDGMTDENNPGGGGMCNSGQLGKCAAGTMQCQNGGLVCVAINMPSPEICNNIDDDCDGPVDEGDPGGGGVCNTGLMGVCAAGTQHCQGGMIVCVQNVQPSPEICNGLNDDCDTMTDEGNPGGGGPCNTGQLGKCAAGTLQCLMGTLQCIANSMPSPEICNNIDDDCDGMTDEGTGGAVCNTGQPGICAPGTMQCQNGSLVCIANNMPMPEICNNLDDDCDNAVDDGNPGGGGACNTGQLGICAAGTVQCINGMLPCIANNMPTIEVCNGLDDDCDGTVDDGNPGGGGPCSTGQQGVCAAGTLQCQNGGLVCVQNTPPSTELCNDGLDNDCDGQTDGNDTSCCHALCSTGNFMTPACNACVAQICGADPFCCQTSWDSLCVQETRTVCGSLTCNESRGTCPHTLCTAGSFPVPFPNNCDQFQANCVSQICFADSYCCTTDWDSICVNEVSSICGLNCTYQ